MKKYSYTPALVVAFITFVVLAMIDLFTPIPDVGVSFKIIGEDLRLSLPANFSWSRWADILGTFTITVILWWLSIDIITRSRYREGYDLATVIPVFFIIGVLVGSAGYSISGLWLVIIALSAIWKNDPAPAKEFLAAGAMIGVGFSTGFIPVIFPIVYILGAYYHGEMEFKSKEVTS